MPRDLTQKYARGGDSDRQHIFGFSVNEELKRLTVDFRWELQTGETVVDTQIRAFDDAEYELTLEQFEQCVHADVRAALDAHVSDPAERDVVMAALEADDGWTIKCLKEALYLRMDQTDPYDTAEITVSGKPTASRR